MVDWIDLAFKLFMVAEISFVTGLWQYGRCVQKYREYRTKVLTAEANWRGGVRYRRRGMTSPQDNWQLWNMRRAYVWRSFFFMKVDHLPNMRMAFITGERRCIYRSTFTYTDVLFQRKGKKMLAFKDDDGEYIHRGVVDQAYTIEGTTLVYFTSKDGKSYSAQIRRRLRASPKGVRKQIDRLRIAVRNCWNTVWLSA